MRTLLTLVLILATGCGMTLQSVAPQALAAAEPYMQGCADVVIAPALSCQWGDRCALGVGGYVGCRTTGPLLELFCRIGEKVECETLRRWYPVDEEGLE